MIDKSKDKKYKFEIKRHFDKKALDYNAEDFIPNCLDQYFRAPFDHIIAKYCQRIDGKKILDYCCGTGINSVVFSKKGAKITGIDLSYRSIQIANKKFKKLNLKNFKFYKMDAHSLNFKDSSFDIIVCYKSMLYLDLNKAFVELKRLLRPNGKIIILENISDNFIFHYYRYLKHILNNKNYSKELNKLKIKDLNLASKFFDYHEIVYFDFFTYFGKIIKDKFKIKISYDFLKFLDNFFLNNFKLKSLSFTTVVVLKKNN